MASIAARAVLALDVDLLAATVDRRRWTPRRAARRIARSFDASERRELAAHVASCVAVGLDPWAGAVADPDELAVMNRVARRCGRGRRI